MDSSPTGRYLEDDDDSTADEHDDLDDCTLCYAGSFGPKEGADEEEDCKECPPGKSSDDGAESCISCAAGEFMSFQKYDRAYFTLVNDCRDLRI